MVWVISLKGPPFFSVDRIHQCSVFSPCPRFLTYCTFDPGSIWDGRELGCTVGIMFLILLQLWQDSQIQSLWECAWLQWQPFLHCYVQSKIEGMPWRLELWSQTVWFCIWRSLKFYSVSPTHSIIFFLILLKSPPMAPVFCTPAVPRCGTHWSSLLVFEKLFFLEFHSSSVSCVPCFSLGP